MSIKPEYAERIISGEKKYEYRKRLSKQPVNSMIVYCTYPVQRVVAEVQIIGTLAMKPTSLWEATKKEAGISRQLFRAYFKGCSTAYAYHLGDVITYCPPKELKEYGIDFAPQSFVYIQDKKD